SYPGQGSAGVAALYFWKSAELNLVRWPWEIWLIAPGGLALVWRRFALTIFLFLPVVFYSFSIAYGSVPIFIAAWWPFSYYNVRYGLEMLPAFAVLAGMGFWLLRQTRRGVLCGALLALLAANSTCIWRQPPICLREGQINSTSRIA